MLLLIDKPTWLTSQDAISAVKKHLYSLPSARQGEGLGVRQKIKIWHSGTLDPMASWLLIAATDKDTKQLHHLTGLDKIYEATIDFTIQTDTRDMDYRKEFEQYEIITPNPSCLRYARPELKRGDQSLKIPPTPLLTLRETWAKGGESKGQIPHRYNKEFIQSRWLLSTWYHVPYSKDAHEKSKQLKKNTTEAEKQLRKFYLQKSWYTVLRQKAIDHYIVDFYIAAYKLVIEVDGEYHTTSDQQEYDEERTKILKFYDLYILRFTNDQVIHSLWFVIQTIEEYIASYKKNEEKDTEIVKKTSTSISPSLVKRGVGGWLVYIEAPSPVQLTKKLETILGTHDLPLTPFSAKKLDGRKLYEYAREWKPIFLTVPMTVHGYKILDYDFPHLTLRLHVGSGTYIRSIAHRLGTQFNLGGTLTMLRRISIGDYSLDQIKNPSIATWDEKEVKYEEI